MWLLRLQLLIMGTFVREQCSHTALPIGSITIWKDKMGTYLIQWRRYIDNTIYLESLNTIMIVRKVVWQCNMHWWRKAFLRREKVDFILNSISFILQHNYFVIDNVFFLQKVGTAIGTRFLPRYVKCFMAFWESISIWEDCYRPNMDRAFWRGLKISLLPTDYGPWHLRDKKTCYYHI